MAIDTAARRFSMLDFDYVVQPGLGAPDAASSEGDRLHLLWLYSGIEAGEIVVPTSRIDIDWGLQGPGEVLDWHIDWDEWLEAGDSLNGSSWDIDPWGILNTGQSPMLSGEDIDLSNNITTVFVAGLEVGVSYELKNTVTTVGGRTGVRAITLRCQRQ